MKNEQGKCLCGETIVKVEKQVKKVLACHCSMCRKQTAGPIFYAEAIQERAVHFLSDTHLSIYSSSKIAERAFCRKCGTFVYFKEKDKDFLHFNVELFDEAVDTLEFKEEIYYEDKPSYYTFANQTKKDG